MEFNHFNRRERKSQNFDKNSITLTKAGKTYNVYDKIQENSEDTEIYQVLEKYGCIDRIMLNKEDVYGDFTAFKGLRDMKDQQIMAENMFYSLPLQTREKFNNDKNLFMKEGEKYIKGLIDAEKAKIDRNNKIIAESLAKETGEKVNG